MLQTAEPEKSRRTKADRTRARLIEVAKRLYQEHGSAHVTVRRIAAAGPHSVPLARLRAALGAHLKFTLRAHFSSRLRSIRRLPKKLRDRHMQQEREYAAIFAGLLEEAHKKGQLRGGFDLSVVRMLMLGALTWVAEWYDPEKPMTPDDVADEMMRLLTGGIAK